MGQVLAHCFKRESPQSPEKRCPAGPKDPDGIQQPGGEKAKVRVTVFRIMVMAT